MTSPIEVKTVSDASFLASKTYFEFRGKVIRVRSVCSNTHVIEASELIRVRVLPTEMDKVLHYTDDEFLDSRWNVEVLDDIALPAGMNLDIAGPSFRILENRRHVREGTSTYEEAGFAEVVRRLGER